MREDIFDLVGAFLCRFPLWMEVFQLHLLFADSMRVSIRDNLEQMIQVLITFNFDIPKIEEKLKTNKKTSVDALIRLISTSLTHPVFRYLNFYASLKRILNEAIIKLFTAEDEEAFLSRFF